MCWSICQCICIGQWIPTCWPQRADSFSHSNYWKEKALGIFILKRQLTRGMYGPHEVASCILCCNSCSVKVHSWPKHYCTQYLNCELTYRSVPGKRPWVLAVHAPKIEGGQLHKGGAFIEASPTVEKAVTCYEAYQLIASLLSLALYKFCATGE